jgi:2-C-methyl-D-erythritol 4-phosphate cytidylyltransferase
MGTATNAPSASGVWCIQLAAGGGRRFGGPRPKQLVALAGRPAFEWSLRDAAPHCEGQVLVVPEALLDESWPDDVAAVVAGGDERADSVRAGLAAVPADAAVIVVHDTARPAAGSALFAAVIAAVRAGADAAIPGVAVIDTIKQVDGDVVVATPDRASLVAVQTPQAFAASVLRAAHASGADATDDAGLVEQAGGTVRVVPGHVGNRKLTLPDDLALLERALGGTG